MGYLLSSSGKRLVSQAGKRLVGNAEDYCYLIVLADCTGAFVNKYVRACLIPEDPTYIEAADGTCYRASVNDGATTDPTGRTEVCDFEIVDGPCCYYLQARDPCNGNALVDVWIKVDDAGGVASDTYIIVDGACYVLKAADAATTSPGTIITTYTVTTSADELCCPPMPCATLAHVNPATDFPSAITIDFTLKELYQSNPGTGTPCTSDNLRCSNVHFTLTLNWNASSVGWGDNADALVCTWENPDFPGSFADFYIREPLVRMVVPKDAFGDWNGNPCYWEIIFWDKMTNPSTGAPACRVVMRRFTGSTPEGGGYAVVTSAGSTCVSGASICYAGWSDTYQNVTLAF